MGRRDRLGAGLSRDFAAVRAAIDRPFPVGQTSLIDAAQAGILLAESGPGRALVLVFSDGLEVSSYLPPDTVLETVKRSDAVIYGVVLRGVPRPPFITELAEGSGGTLLETASPTDIAAAPERRCSDNCRTERERDSRVQAAERRACERSLDAAERSRHNGLRSDGAAAVQVALAVISLCIRSGHAVSQVWTPACSQESRHGDVVRCRIELKRARRTFWVRVSVSVRRKS